MIKYYRTSYGRWVASDCAGWIPGSWRFRWSAALGVRKYLRGLS